MPAQKYGNTVSVRRMLGHCCVGLLGTIVLLGGCANLPTGVEAPYITLVNLRVVEVTLFEQRYELQLRIQNPNDFELPITGMDYKVHINDKKFGHGVSNASATVPAYGEQVVTVYAVSTLLNVIEQLRDLQEGQPIGLSYRLSGGLQLSNRLGKIPFDYRGELKLEPIRDIEPDGRESAASLQLMK